MGSKNVTRTQGINISEWEMISEGNKFNILKNKITNQQIEEYNQIFSDQKQFQKELTNFEKRLQQCLNVVQIKGWSDQQSKEMCSTFWNVKVYVQRIPKRLKNTHNLSLGKALWVLHQSIKGFSNISKQYPNYIQITDGMICFDTEDNVKVWLNEDLAKNFPNSQLSYNEIEPYAVEHKIIMKLIEIVQKHKEFRKFPDNFYAYMDKYLFVPYKFQQTLQMCQLYFDQENLDQVLLPHQSQNQKLEQVHFKNLAIHQLEGKKVDSKPLLQKQIPKEYIKENIFSHDQSEFYKKQQQKKFANNYKPNESPQQFTIFNPYNLQNQGTNLNSKNTQVHNKYNPQIIQKNQYYSNGPYKIMNKGTQTQLVKQQMNNQILSKKNQSQFVKQYFNKQPQLNHFYQQQRIPKNEHRMQYHQNTFPNNNSQMLVQKNFQNKSIQFQFQHSNNFIGQMPQSHFRQVHKPQNSFQPTIPPISQPRSLSQMGISGPVQAHPRSNSNFNRPANMSIQQNQQINKPIIKKSQLSFFPKSNQSNIYQNHFQMQKPKTIQGPIESHPVMNPFINSIQNTKRPYYKIGNDSKYDHMEQPFNLSHNERIHQIHQIQYNQNGPKGSLMNRGYENRDLSQFGLMNFGKQTTRQIGQHPYKAMEMGRVVGQLEAIQVNDVVKMKHQ